MDSQATSLAGFGGPAGGSTSRRDRCSSTPPSARSTRASSSTTSASPSAPTSSTATCVVGYRWTKPTRTVPAHQLQRRGVRHVGLRLGQHRRRAVRQRQHPLPQLLEDVGPDRGNPQTINIRSTRGGPAILNPPGFDGAVASSSDDRKKVVLGLDFYYNRYQQGADNSWGIDTYVEWRPMQRLQLSVGPSLSRNLTSAQYIGTYADPTATATYGNRYVFGDLDQWTLSGNIRLNWIFTPKLSLELFMQPFLSSGNYRAVQGAGRTADVRLQRVRPERLDLRSDHRHRRPGRPGWPGGTDRHRGPELPVCARCAATRCCGGSGRPARRCSWCGRTTGPIRPIR